MKTTLPITLVAVAFAFGINSASAADAAATWTSSCASCHGADGKGQTTMGKKQKVGDYTDAAVQAKFTDEEAVKAILEGKNKMKGFKDKVSEEDAKALVKYVRAFKK